MKFITKIIYLLLILLPIVDFLYRWQEDTYSPALYLRAMTLLSFIFIAITNIRSIFTKNDLSIKLFWHFLFYILLISFCCYVGTNTLYALIRAVFAILGLLIFYYLTKNNIITEKEVTFFFLLLIIILATTTYLNLDYRLNTQRELRTADNTGYALLCVYAAIMLLIHKRIFPIALFLVVIGTFISGKRGAIVGLVVSSLPLIRYFFTSKQWKASKKIFFTVLILISVSIAIHVFGDYLSASIGRFQMLEEDHGSGRDTILKLYWQHFKESNLINQIFGHGVYAGIWSSGSKYAFYSKMAHNDWIEILYDFGIIGVLLYLSIFIRVFLILLRNRRNRTNYFYMLEMAFLIWFLTSIFSSTFLMNINSIYLFIILAYSIAKLEPNSSSTESTSTLLQSNTP